VEQNDRKAPSVRHLKRKCWIGAETLYEILERLERAHLLRKVSGLRESGNMPNQYNLFDPLSQEQFVKAAKAGAFRVPTRDGLRDGEPRRGVPGSGAGVCPSQGQGVFLPQAQQQTCLEQTYQRQTRNKQTGLWPFLNCCPISLMLTTSTWRERWQQNWRRWRALSRWRDGSTM
jgi:hypothetical protein